MRERMGKVTKKAKVQLVRQLILRDNAFLHWAILIIHNNQTYEEQAQKTTMYINGRGFNKNDAGVMSRFARQIQQGFRLYGDDLQEARRRMRKYARQVAVHADLRSLFFQAHVRGSISRETAKALLLSANGNEFWVPKSLIASTYKNTSSKLQDFLVLPDFVEEKIGEVVIGTILKSTEKALQIQLDYGEEWWVPKSVILSEYNLNLREVQRFLIFNWFLMKKQGSVKTPSQKRIMYGSSKGKTNAY
jgi:hypothetical protein